MLGCAAVHRCCRSVHIGRLAACRSVMGSSWTAGQEGWAWGLVQAMLEVAAFPEDSICAISFNFWHRVSRLLTSGFSQPGGLALLVLFRRGVCRLFCLCSSVSTSSLDSRQRRRCNGRSAVAAATNTTAVPASLRAAGERGAGPGALPRRLRRVASRRSGRVQALALCHRRHSAGCRRCAKITPWDLERKIDGYEGLQTITAVNNSAECSTILTDAVKRLDAVVLKGQRTLALLSDPLQQELTRLAAEGGLDWRTAEAALFCIRCTMGMFRAL